MAVDSNLVARRCIEKSDGRERTVRAVANAKGGGEGS